MRAGKSTTYYEALYKSMVGQTFNRLTVLEYLGSIAGARDGSRMVRCQCECGSVNLYRACDVYKGNVKHCGECTGYVSDRVTICLRCRKATNRHLCQWADGKPRTDWVAEETHHKRDGYNSYRVIKCPGFEPDRRK